MPEKAKPGSALAQEQHKTTMRGGLAMLLSTACLVAASLWLPLFFRFPQGAMEGLLYACQISVIPGLALMMAVRVVANIRFWSTADNKGSAFAVPSPRLAIPAAFLQNTLEQTVLAIIANMALATIGSTAAMAYMTAGIALFVIGRVAFLVGYRSGAGGRAFGMVTTMTPALGAFGWVVVSWFL